MPNRMVQRRALLRDYLKSKLPDHFKFAERLRLETFKSETRPDRVRVMGDPTAYCEVLYGGDSTVDQEDTGGRAVLDVDPFRVNVWFAYYDAETYENSSQAKFDSLMFDDDEGIITGLREVETINPTGYHPGVPLDITGIESTVVSLDESGIELAHFLTFNVTIR